MYMDILWKDIPGFEGIYQASNTGSIRTKPGKVTSNRRYAHREWKTRVLKAKYPKNRKRKDARVTLWKDGKESDHLVSRLVAMAWVDGYAPGLTVNHIDGNPENNTIENLEWLSLGDNVRKGYETGLFDKCQKKITLIGESDCASFASMAQASRFLGRNNGYIHNCIKVGKKPTSEDGQIYTIKEGD
jgi:hypothetical protein